MPGRQGHCHPPHGSHSPPHGPHGHHAFHHRGAGPFQSGAFVNSDEFPWNGVFDVFGNVFRDIESSLNEKGERSRHRGPSRNIRVSPYTARFGPFARGSDSTVTPAVDVFDTPESYIVVASVAGASPSNIGVDYNPKTRELTISGEIAASIAGKDDEYRKNHLRVAERSYGHFERKVTIPEEPSVDEENIQAKFSNGLLKVILPKVEPVPVPKKKVVVTIDDDGDEELADAATVTDEKSEEIKEKTPDSDEDSVLVETPDEN